MGWTRRRCRYPRVCDDGDDLVIVANREAERYLRRAARDRAIDRWSSLALLWAAAMALLWLFWEFFLSD